MECEFVFVDRVAVWYSDVLSYNGKFALSVSYISAIVFF